MDYDPERGKFFCPTCHKSFSVCAKTILSHWCDIWLLTIKSNRDANISLLSNATPDNLQLFGMMNHGLGDIEKEILIYLDDKALRHELMIGCPIKPNKSVVEYIQAISKWAETIVNKIRAWIKEKK